jgi:hypothetical protein
MILHRHDNLRCPLYAGCLLFMKHLKIKVGIFRFFANKYEKVTVCNLKPHVHCGAADCSSYSLSDLYYSARYFVRMEFVCGALEFL